MKFVRGHVEKIIYQTYWYTDLDEFGEHHSIMLDKGWQYIHGTQGYDHFEGRYVEATYKRKEE